MGKQRVEALFTVLIVGAVLLLGSGTAGARFRFQADVTSSIEFNDNIFSAVEEPASDTIWSFSPSIVFSEERGDGSTFVTFGYSKRDYRRNNDQDRETYTASFSARRQLTRKTFVNVFETFTTTPVVRTQSVNFAQVFTQAGIVSQLVLRRETARLISNSFGGMVEHRLTPRTTLSFEGSVNARRFNLDAFDDSTETRASGKLEYRPSGRDLIKLGAVRRFYESGENLMETTTDTFSLAWERQVSDSFRSRTRLILIDDTDDQLNVGRTVGSRSTQVRLGGTYDIDANTRLNGDIGLIFVRRTGDIGANVEERGIAPVFEASLQRSFVRSNLSLQLRQSFNTGYESGFDTTFLGLEYSYQFNRDTSLSVGLSRSVSTSGEKGNVDTDTTTVYIRLNYMIDRRTYFSILYSGVDQTSVGASAGNVTQNILIFSIDIFDLTPRRP